MRAGKLSNRPIRILHVVGGMDRGGTETWLMNVLHHIDRARISMDFLVHTTQPRAFDDEIRSLGSKIIPCLHPYRPRLYAQNLTRILKKDGPYDVIHSHVHQFSGFVMRLAERAGVPLRISHSHSVSCAEDGRSGLARSAYRSLMRYWIQRYSILGLAASREAAIALFGENWESDSRWKVLHCGIDLTPFRARPDTAKVRAEFNIPPGTFVIGHVGRFHPQKNHNFLISIFTAVVRREPSTLLLLIGQGELEGDVMRRVKREGLSDHVRFLGVRPDVPRLMMAAMDVFLFPSLYEGLGIVLLEAQAAGLLSVVSDVIPEEADVFKPLVIRLPLSQTPDFWAGQILACRAHACLRSSPDCAPLMEGGDFDISRSVSGLVELYRSSRSRADSA